MTEISMLVDVSKCTACRGCQVACKQWNDLPAVTTFQTGTYQNPPDLSKNTWNLVKFTEVGDGGDKVKWLFRAHRCMHCTEAACVKVCPTGALYYHESGAVGYDENICTGCGYCVEFCPFKIPRSEGNRWTGKSTIGKCIFCLDRITNNEQPACAKTCPPVAIKFGPRDQMIAEARTRVDYLKQTNAKAQIYGLDVVGGTHNFYILEDDPKVYDLPAKPMVPVAATAWQDVIQPLGYVLGGVMVVGLAFNYVMARALIKREKREKEESKHGRR